MSKELYETKIVETLDGGHQVQFKIGVQTFSLQETEVFEGDEWNTKQYAEWYEKNLCKALDKLIELAKQNERESKKGNG